jgi:uncharacterized membrane protein YgdD (TMEM256/DUF423 family)
VIRYAPLIAALLGFSGVALGAFGAHGLKSAVSAEWLEVWKTAVSYQMYHAPVILLLPYLTSLDARWRQRAVSCFTAGVLVFSGSLYLLVALNLPKFGMITPFGGLCLMAGWLCLLLAGLRRK